MSIRILEYELSFNLFRYSLILSAMLYGFQSTSLALILLKFISMYFIRFDDIVNGVIFLISFLNCSLLVYRNTLHVYI